MACTHTHTNINEHDSSDHGPSVKICKSSLFLRVYFCSGEIARTTIFKQDLFAT